MKSILGAVIVVGATFIITAGSMKFDGTYAKFDGAFAADKVPAPYKKSSTKKPPPNREAASSAPQSAEISDPDVSPASYEKEVPKEKSAKWDAKPRTASTASARNRTSVTSAKSATSNKSFASLPNDDGQEWREYDLSYYTSQVSSTATPERAILEWILRETGEDTWHTGPISVLHADGKRLRVYHTPEVQRTVAEVVDRFMNPAHRDQSFTMNIYSIANPNWRVKALPFLRPMDIQSEGIQAWLIAREDAAQMQLELRKRSDFRELGSPHLFISNGQATMTTKTRPRPYVKDISLTRNTWPGFENVQAQATEGFTLEFSPLLSYDGQTIDAVIKGEFKQVEKLLPVMLEVPTTVAPRQRSQIEVPQMVQYQVNERFRWPSDRILIVSLGSVPSPAQDSTSSLLKNIPLISSPARGEVLIFIENKANQGQVDRPAAETAARNAIRNGRRDPKSYNGGRY